MNTTLLELRREKRKLVHEFRALADSAERRALDADEVQRIDDLKKRLDKCEDRIDALEAARDLGGDSDDSDDNEPVQTAGRSRVGMGRKSTPTWPSVHTSSRTHRDPRQFSLHRAIKGLLGGRMDGVEREMSDEIERREGRSPSGLGFFLPLEYRDTPTDTTTAAGAVTNFYAQDFLLLLRKQAILDKLGVPLIDNIQGNYIQPYETSGATSQWVAEGSGVVANAMDVSYVKGVPRCLTTKYVTSRQVIASSSYDVENLLIKDMTNATAETLNTAFVSGDGTGANPTGLLNNTAIDTTALASGGVTIAYGDTLAMIAAVQNANPPEGSVMRFLTSPNGSQTLKSTPRVSGSTPYPVFVQQGSQISDVDSVISPCVPSDLTYGSPGTANCTALIYGSFGEACRHLVWRNLEVLIDPYTGASQNQVSIYTILTTDLIVVRPSLLNIAYFK